MFTPAYPALFVQSTPCQQAQSDALNIAPGEPAPGTPAAAPPAVPANAQLDVPTGTPVDGVPTGADVDMSEFADDPAAQSILAYYEARAEQSDPNAELTAAQRADDQAAQQAAQDDSDPGPDSTPPVAPVGDPIVPPAPVAQTIMVNGQEVAVDDLKSIAEWALSLPPEQAQGINDLLSGEYVLAPRDQYQPPPQPPVYAPQQQPYGAPGVPPAASGISAPGPYGVPAGVAPGPGAPGFPPQFPAEVDLSALRDLAPGLDQYLAAQAAQQQQIIQQNQVLQSQQATFLAQQAADQRAHMSAQLEAGAGRFRDAHPEVTDDVARTLVGNVSRMQVIPGLVQQTGDPSVAMEQALEAALYMDPAMRQATIQAQLDAFATQQQTTDQRKQRAAALSASGAPVPRTAPISDPRTMTKAQRDTAMIEEVAQAMNVGSN